MGESSIYSITSNSKNWPELLQELPVKARPKSLFVKGTLPPADTLIVAIVGTRRPTAYGRDATEEIARALARKKIVIASGLAVGVDTIAHRIALEENIPTIAILGSGLDEKVFYPQENLALARRIVESGGALVSEYTENQKPELWTFPQRNRIIAGIAKAVVVIEAGEKSGALITARFATEYGRDVYALPGAITNPMAVGTNSLLRQGANVITSPEDILEGLGFERELSASLSQEQVTEDEQKILDALAEELALDDIIKKTCLPAHKILASSTALEMRGLIKSTAGGVYRKVF